MSDDDDDGRFGWRNGVELARVRGAPKSWGCGERERRRIVTSSCGGERLKMLRKKEDGDFGFGFGFESTAAGGVVVVIWSLGKGANLIRRCICRFKSEDEQLLEEME